MSGNAPPSQNPANVDSLTGLFDLVLTKFLQGVDDMLPARVIAYNRVTNRAQVQPMISMVTTLNEIVARGQIASIPVLQIGGGGFVLSFPIRTGDLGWIKANDRDISLFKKNYASAPPNTQRKHSFSDALFIPDTMLKQVTIAAEDLTNTVFQNLAGTVRLALWADKLKITAPSTSIGDTANYAPSAHAILDLLSTTRALGLPAMTTGQKNAIPSPRPGFQVFDTSLDAVSTYTAGGGWDP